MYHRARACDVSKKPATEKLNKLFLINKSISRGCRYQPPQRNVPVSQVFVIFHIMAWRLLLLIAWASIACACVQVTSIPSLFTEPVLDSEFLIKWKTPLPNPLNSRNIFQPNPKVTGFDYYHLSMRQVTQQILPAGCPVTQVFAYGLASDPLDNPASFSTPSKSIIATKGRQTVVQWVHTELPNTHLFAIDRSFHCGNRALNCSPDVRTIAHLHGGHIEWESDGFPEAWQASDGTTGSQFIDGMQTYANDQESAMLWFHDHTSGITRLNVYAGLAGFYIIRDSRELSLQALNQLPRYPYEMPIVIQDRYFYPNGSLAYPDVPFAGPSRISNSVFGNVYVVNGVAFPNMRVERRRYRIRILNGCNARFLSLAFASNSLTPSTIPVVQIGSDGGFLNAPVVMTSSRIVLSPGERVDLVVDFSSVQPNEVIFLTNTGATPYPGGTVPATTSALYRVVRFTARQPLNLAISQARAPPTTLRSRPLALPSLTARLTRKLVLYDSVDLQHTRLIRLLGTNLRSMRFCDAGGITETPALGATEIWEVYNPTGDSHPIHIHLVQFQVIDRRNIVYPTPSTPGAYGLGSIAYPVLANERGLKDTIRVEPGHVVRVIATFDRPGLYVWHCHNLEVFLLYTLRG